MKRYLALVAALLLTACASTDRDMRPDWTDGNSETYPSNAYLVGIGSADDLATARDRARADVAKIFRVSINATSSDAQRYSERESAGEASSAYSSEIQRDLVVSTRQVLEGVTVPESWRDPETGRHHALAVLKRAQTSARLRQDVAGLDAAAETLVQRARAADDTFTRAQLALEVVENQRRRAVLQDMLRAVDSSGRGVPSRWPLAQLEADLATALSRITLRVEGDAGWRSLLAGQLSDSGFDVSDAGEYVVSLDVEESANKRDGWHWLRGVAVLSVTGKDGESLGQHRFDIKESATDAGTARLRFRQRVAEVIASEGREAILAVVRN